MVPQRFVAIHIGQPKTELAFHAPPPVLVEVVEFPHRSRGIYLNMRPVESVSARREAFAEIDIDVV